MTWWWLANEKMTVLVAVDEQGYIRQTPPIVARFNGQAIGKLKRWMAKKDGYHERQVPDGER
jgi:hypothetical protein